MGGTGSERPPPLFPPPPAVTHNGRHDIYGSPFHPAVAPAPTVASHCLVTGPGASTASPGGPNSFTVDARDQFDEPRGIGGDVFLLTVVGPGTGHAVVDNGDGTYTVSYDIDTDAKASKQWGGGEG